MPLVHLALSKAMEIDERWRHDIEYFLNIQVIGHFIDRMALLNFRHFKYLAAWALAIPDSVTLLLIEAMKSFVKELGLEPDVSNKLSKRQTSVKILKIQLKIPFQAKQTTFYNI